MKHLHCFATLELHDQQQSAAPQSKPSETAAAAFPAPVVGISDESMARSQGAHRLPAVTLSRAPTQPLRLSYLRACQLEDVVEEADGRGSGARLPAHAVDEGAPDGNAGQELPLPHQVLQEQG